MFRLGSLSYLYAQKRISRTNTERSLEAISRIKKKEQLTKINIQLGQEEIKQGELLRVSATLSETVPEIWLRLLDKDNVIVQRAGLVARNKKSFHMLMATSHLDFETYTIQVSTNKKFSPMNLTEFRVKGRVPFLVPLLPLAVGVNPEDPFKKIKDQKKKPSKDDISKKKPKKPKIKIKFRTMMDKKVDAACKKFENKVYDIDDKTKPQIRIHFGCRCWYEILSVDDQKTFTTGALYIDPQFQ